MKYYYRIKADTILDELGHEHTVYGIAIYQNGKAFPERIIGDIFCERDAAEWFVGLCNDLELCPEQLDDAVADVIVA
ncbi:MAG: hypothetical protein IJ428_01810 [Clostridia bacterium]|nr:hypothetical protein [Clostridia bacterium]